MKKTSSKKKTSRSRRTVQWLGFFATSLMAIRHLIPSSHGSGSSTRSGAFDSVCPMGGIETFYSYITTGNTLLTTNLFNFAVLLGVLAVSVVAGRAFCGWMCPLGTLQDMFAEWTSRLFNGSKPETRTKSKYPIELPPKVDKVARNFKYLILLVVLFASTKSVYPPLRDICPARAIFGFELHEGLLISVLVTFILTSLLVKRFWCKYLCPLGAFLAIFNKIALLRVKIDVSKCAGCGICEMDCPMDIPAIPESMRDLECIQCLDCIDSCPIEDTIVLKLG